MNDIMQLSVEFVISLYSWSYLNVPALKENTENKKIKNMLLILDV